MPKPSQHPDETSLLKDLKDIQRRLQALEGQTRLESASVGRGGLKIKEGGDLRVVNADNQVIGWIGYIGNFADPDGNPQPGMAWYRNDDSGQTLAMSLLDWDSTDADGYHQVLRFNDRKGHTILEDDPGGMGLNAPGFSLATWNQAQTAADASAMMGSTTNSSAEGTRDVAFCPFSVQNPLLRVEYECMTRGIPGAPSLPSGAGALVQVRLEYWAWNVNESAWQYKSVNVHSQQHGDGGSWVWDAGNFLVTIPDDCGIGYRAELILSARHTHVNRPDAVKTYGRFREVRSHGHNMT